MGQLLFGVLADRWSRTGSLLVSTVILIIFTALAAGSYYRGDPVAMFNMLTAWRFFVSFGHLCPPDTEMMPLTNAYLTRRSASALEVSSNLFVRRSIGSRRVSSANTKLH